MNTNVELTITAFLRYAKSAKTLAVDVLGADTEKQNPQKDGRL